MQIIRKRCFARAGLVGNPSDGYHGKTVSVIVRDFWAEVVLYEWDEVQIIASEQDHSRFGSVQELALDVKLHGYYGGIRLVKGTIKRFVEYCHSEGLKLHNRNFAVRYHSAVPRQVGLAGSTAIIVATLRCLMEFYGVEIPLEVQPSIALAVETQELHIAAGLQDRVVEVYEGLVYMDFSREKMRERSGHQYGLYERLDPLLLPPLYLAYKAELGEPTEVFHNDIRARFDRGEPAVVNAMLRCAELAEQARGAILARDATRLAKMINENFDMRRAIYKLAAAQVQMVDVARGVGASANFAGSGGAIVGTYQGEAMFQDLQRELGKIGCVVIKPKILPEQATAVPGERQGGLA